MLPTDFEGNTPTIENVFHSLNTRLIFIKTGIAKHGKYYDGDDYECKPHEAIYDIQSKVHGYSPASALGEIENSLALIDRIQIAIEIIPKVDEVDAPDSWSVHTDYTPNIKDELDQYKVFLEELQENLLSREELTITNSDASFIKIKLNIKVEELAGLIYFLDHDKIFKSKQKPLSRAFAKIISHANGENFSAEYLNNSVYSFMDDGSIVSFWRDKFIDYVNQTNAIPKKKNK